MIKRYTQKPTIKLSNETMKELKKEQLVSGETYEDTIKRLLKFYRENVLYAGVNTW